MKSKNVYPSKADGEKWAVVKCIVVLNGKRTRHKIPFGMIKFQLKELSEFRQYLKEKFAHDIQIDYVEELVK